MSLLSMSPLSMPYGLLSGSLSAWEVTPGCPETHAQYSRFAGSSFQVGATGPGGCPQTYTRFNCRVLLWAETAAGLAAAAHLAPWRPPTTRDHTGGQSDSESDWTAGLGSDSTGNDRSGGWFTKPDRLLLLRTAPSRSPACYQCVQIEDRFPMGKQFN